MLLPEAAEGSLADQLYSQTVSRLYLSETELPVMMVIAYGNTQSDQLQLHRPEVCYAAVGFEISASERVEIPVSPTMPLPARRGRSVGNAADLRDFPEMRVEALQRECRIRGLASHGLRHQVLSRVQADVEDREREAARSASVA